MQALQYREFGEPADVVAPADVNPPKPSAEEVLVRVSLTPIHNHDLATIRGVYGVKPSLPAIGGSELCGVVDGKRVSVMTRGAWSEFALAHRDALVPIPDGIPDEAAAQPLDLEVRCGIGWEVHENCSSSSAIWATRRACRPPSNAVERKTSTISSASPSPTTRAPIDNTFASLC